jgi:CheY-like chemotaxis protein
VIRSERFLRRVRPDLVVLDCLLVGGDGLKLARQLALEAKVPVIVTSGDIDKAEQAAEAGFVCLRKPLDPDGGYRSAHRSRPCPGQGTPPQP